MDSSSGDEDVMPHCKALSKRVIDSDDEADDDVKGNSTEANEDFKLHLSDEGDDDGGTCTTAQLCSTLDVHNEESVLSTSHSARNGDECTVIDRGIDEEEILGRAFVSEGEIGMSNEVKMSIKTSGTRGREDIMKSLSALADSDSESDIDSNLNDQPKGCLKRSKSSNKNFLDSDSDTDCDKISDNNLNNSEMEMKTLSSTSKQNKNKSGPERKSKAKAKNAMLEIKAESQRQLRQSKIGLPYHIPKQRSLMDFLNRRKPSFPVPMKGPMEQLTAVWKHIEEREKEVEEFYKSESEHGSDADDDDECTEESDLPRNEETNGNSDDLGTPKHQSCGSTDCTGNPIIVLPDSGLDTKNLQSDSQLSEELKSEHMNDASEAKTTVLKPSSVTSLAENDDSESVLGTVLTVVHDPSENDNFCSAVCDSEVGKEHVIVERINEQNTVNRSASPRTQDSQNISLHFNGTEAKTLDSSENITLILSEDSLLNAEDSNALKPNEGTRMERCEMSLENKSIPMANDTRADGETWEELNAAMKRIVDEDFIPKNAAVGENIPKKLSSVSGPRLSLKGAPDDVIDLDNSNPNKPQTAGLKSLIDRFMKHSAPKIKPVQAQTVELSIISSEKNTRGGIVDVKQESLKIVLASDENVRSHNLTPGARLKLLKSELNRQMRKQKEEEWQRKQEEMNNDQVYDGEKDDCGQLPDEDEEEEMTESETESEPELNDVREPKEKKKVKSMFVDEEAEVDEDDEDGGGGDEREDSEGDESNDGEEKDAGDYNGDDFDDEDDGDKNVDGSDAEEGNKINVTASHKEDNDNEALKSGSMRRTMTSVSDLFASQSSGWREEDDDDVIPAAQPNPVSLDGPLTELPDAGKKNSFLFSPMSLSVPGKSQCFMDVDLDITPSKLTWTIESKSQNGITKLFTEPEPSSTQEKLEELAGLFAEKFNDSNDKLGGLANTLSSAESETDLMALCSGKFVSQPPLLEDLEGECAQASNVFQSQFVSQTPGVEPSQASTLPVEDSEDFSLKWDEDTKDDKDTNTSIKAISEKFRLEIMSSDEDDSVLMRETKKRNRKLEFSDDEEDGSLKKENDKSDSELCESDDDCNISEQGKSKLFSVFNKPSEEVFYDSDENEIQPGDFLDKEAELSEEEDWQGSDDEDEKGLDQMEMNEADKEDIDQDLVREQLVKNHMQKMLDEDRRDVRILQEMLLEDGELHSDVGGRERQFRWRNVDSTGMGDNTHHSDEEPADHEEEEDAEWRKQRHEREMFLKEQREKLQKEASILEDDEILENSELLQLGKSVLLKKRSSINETVNLKEMDPPKLTAHNHLLSPDGKKPNMLLSKRGSFLSRGDNVLAKLAKLTGSAKENVLTGAKSTGKFVFSAISPTKNESKLEDDFDFKSTKRKASGALADPAEKKPCLLAPGRKGNTLFDHL